jgi:hypothetical protein
LKPTQGRADSRWLPAAPCASGGSVRNVHKGGWSDECSRRVSLSVYRRAALHRRWISAETADCVVTFGKLLIYRKGAPPAKWGKQVTKKSHEAEKSDNGCYSSLDITCAALLLSFGWSEQGDVSLSVESAQARVGRPLTPVSVAGVARRHTRRAVYGAGAIGAGAAAVGTAATVAATSPNWGWGGSSYDTDTGYYSGDPYYRRGALGARAAYCGGAPYAASANDGHPWYAVRAYYQDGPWYGYSGWDDYAARNAIGCTPGTLVKGKKTA